MNTCCNPSALHIMSLKVDRPLWEKYPGNHLTNEETDFERNWNSKPTDLPWYVGPQKASRHWGRRAGWVNDVATSLRAWAGWESIISENWTKASAMDRSTLRKISRCQYLWKQRSCQEDWEGQHGSLYLLPIMRRQLCSWGEACDKVWWVGLLRKDVKVKNKR